MTCQHGICQKTATKVPIICIGSKDPERTGIHIVFQAMMGCDQHAQSIEIEDILNEGGWESVRKECIRQNMIPDVKTLGFHLAPIDKVIAESRIEIK